MTTQASEALYNFKTNMQLVYQVNSNPRLGFWLSGNQYSHLSIETSIQQHTGLVDPDTFSDVSVRSAGGMAPDPSPTAGDSLAFPPDASRSGNGGGDGSGGRRVMHDRDPTLPSAAGRMEWTRSEAEARERRRVLRAGEAQADVVRRSMQAGQPPSQVDWVAAGKVTPVRNQGNCGELLLTDGEGGTGGFGVWMTTRGGRWRGWAWRVAAGRATSVRNQVVSCCWGLLGWEGYILVYWGRRFCTWMRAKRVSGQLKLMAAGRLTSVLCQGSCGCVSQP